MRILLLFIMLPFLSTAQDVRSPSDAANNKEAKDIFTEWQCLQRPTARNPLRTFYRFGYVEGEYHIELKLSIGGLDFAVTRDALFEIETESGTTIGLHNTRLQRSCKGCGSRNEDEDIPGVKLILPIEKFDIITLCQEYVAHISLHLPDAIVGDNLTLRRTELFQEELVHFKHYIDHHL